jgi:hypothetical protein
LDSGAVVGPSSVSSALSALLLEEIAQNRAVHSKDTADRFDLHFDDTDSAAL